MTRWIARQAARHVALMGAVLLAGATFAGCGSSATSSTVAQPTSLPFTPCDGKAAPGDARLSIPADGLQRTLILHIPRGYTDRKPTPLVLNLHGSGSNATAQAAFSGMDATADADGFVVAYPQGAIASGSGFDWNVARSAVVRRRLGATRCRR